MSDGGSILVYGLAIEEPVKPSKLYKNLKERYKKFSFTFLEFKYVLLKLLHEERIIQYKDGLIERKKPYGYRMRYE